MVLFDPLPTATAVPALAPSQLGVNEIRIDGNSSGQTLQKGNHPRAMRFSGCVVKQLGHGMDGTPVPRRLPANPSSPA